MRGYSRTLAALVLLVVAGCGAPDVLPANPSQLAASSKRDVYAQGALGFRDEDFWKDPDSPRSEFLFGLLRAKFEGLVLDGPRRVVLDEHGTLPLAGVRICKLARSFEAPLRWNAILVGVHQESDRVLAGLAFRRKGDGPPTRPTTIPDKLDAEQFSMEARAALDGFPWEPGTWRIYLLIGRERSNPIDVQLVDGNPGPVPPPGDGQSAIELAAKATRDGSRALLRGTLRLPSNAAKVPVTFVITGDAEAKPVILSLQLANGPFEVDLLQGKRTLLGQAKTYTIWAFHRKFVSNPCRLDWAGH